MKRSRMTLAIATLLGAVTVGACDIAKQSDLEKLQAEHAATQDSLARLLAWTSNTVLYLGARAHAFDTVPPPPRCPPNCPSLTQLMDSLPAAPAQR